MRWFEIPMYLLRPLVAAVPRLLAEESLMAVERAQVGSGNLKKEDATKVIRSWQRAANPDAPSRRIATSQEIRSFLSGMPGVEVVREPAGGN